MRGAVAVAVGVDRIRAVLDEHVDRISRDIAALIPDLVRNQVREQVTALLGQLAPSMPSVPAPKRAARTPSPAVKPPPVRAKQPAAKSAAPARTSMSRDAVVKLFKAGRSHAEIAAELGISTHSSEQHVYAARKAGILPPKASRQHQSRPVRSTKSVDEDDSEDEAEPVERLEDADASESAAIVLRSTVAPCSVLPAKPLGQRYSEAELAEARRKIVERRARELVPVVKPALALDEAPLAPIVAELPIPRCTFIVDTSRRRFADEDFGAWP